MRLQIGFSIGGIAKRFLVAPPSMIWPANLVTCALFNTLHSQQYSGMGTRGGISRERFFTFAFLGSLVWYFFPGYIFQALGFFNWVCWAAPDNIVVNQLFGYYSGLGMSLITFDWSQIAYIGSPLATPWWASANVAVGFVFFFWILTPILYYTNTWYSKYMPISSRTSFDNTGAAYDVSRILTPESTLDLAKYQAYSPLFLSTTFAISYGLSFAGITATIVHTALYYRKQIWIQARRSLSEQPDIHARLMSRYRQVPEWWYSLIFGALPGESQAPAVANTRSSTSHHVRLCRHLYRSARHRDACLGPRTRSNHWYVTALSKGFQRQQLTNPSSAFVYTVPIGMIQAITNQQIGLKCVVSIINFRQSLTMDNSVITELVIGYALPGRPIAMMMFKTWGYITMYQALQFTSDFKLAHYMKLP